MEEGGVVARLYRVRTLHHKLCTLDPEPRVAAGSEDDKGDGDGKGEYGGAEEVRASTTFMMELQGSRWWTVTIRPESSTSIHASMATGA